MFQVKLYLNKDLLGTPEFDRTVSAKEVISPYNISDLDTITFKLNNEFVNSNKLLSEDCTLECVGFNTEEGFRIYQDSAIFIMAKAFYKLFESEWRLTVKHSIGDGIYCEVVGENQFTEDDMNNLKTEMNEIVSKELYIERVDISVAEAEKIFSEQSRDDVIKNLKFNHSGYTTLFRCAGYYDYYIRQLSDNTGIIREFELNYTPPGFCIRFPLITTKKVQAAFNYPRKLFAIHNEADKWLDILKNNYIFDLNKKIEKSAIAEDIQIEEALHEKKIVGFAEEIRQRKDIIAVLIAGPSSSGKTTFAKRLSIQLQVNGLKPIIIGLDEYFHPRTKAPRKPNGEYDFESIKAIDLELFNEHLELLLEGKEIELPKYDFITGTRLSGNHRLKLSENNILLIEGIHGLNDELTTSIPAGQKIKIYISCLNQINIDRHNRIATTYFRKIRRIVRDNYFRGYSAEVTLSRWKAISEGEHLNIFPFQENADLIFNSGLTYEVNVLKKHALHSLHRISRFSPEYTEAQKMIVIIEHALDIPDSLVPTNSLLREFIGGGVFQY